MVDPTVEEASTERALVSGARRVPAAFLLQAETPSQSTFDAAAEMRRHH